MPRPTGTVTFAFTDIEGSTQRWERDSAAMQAAVRRHDDIVNDAIARHHGYAFKRLGDAFCGAFARPADAVAAMLDAQRALAREDFSAVDGLRVRSAIHTGTADERGGDYFGPALNRVARLLTIGHGGQILISSVSRALLGGEVPPDATLHDLGEHALKDLVAPERVYQLDAPDLPSTFPPLRSTPAHASNLPERLTSFVGRERELSEIAALIRAHRLVTLTGSGGVGKTRTALQAAAGVIEDFDGGVWLVELDSLSNGDHIASMISHALGITLPHGGDPREQLLRALKPKEALLVLDNCEHLAQPVARIASDMLSACPKIKILASSRQPLEIGGEQTYRLPPLQSSAAVALFAQRARAVEERFELNAGTMPVVTEICERLDGIPLAIELAASRTAVLSVNALLERLNERFRLLTQKGGDRLPRQQTLRALIDWSYDLLDEDERTVFRRLSIFSGGFTLPAAAAVCAGDDVDEWQVFELLSALISKSLVTVAFDGEDRRYGMLHTIREYARERLDAAGTAAETSAKHAKVYADLTGSLVSLVDALEDARWQRALACELDNLRTALNWAFSSGGDSTVALQTLAHLEWPELLTTPQEAIVWFDSARNNLEAPVETIVRSRVMRHHARLEWLVGRSTNHREQNALRALAVARETGEPNETAHALTILASIYRDAARFDEAEALFAQAYAFAPSLAPLTINTLLRNWAVSNLQQGNLESARRRFTEVALRERPSSEAHASALLNLGELEFAAGNVDAARAAARAARATFAMLNAAPLGLALCNLAAYSMSAGDLVEARELLDEALDLLKRTGARWTVAALEHHALLAALSNDCERAALLAGFANARYAGDDTRQTTERIGRQRLQRILGERYDDGELSRRMDAGACLTDEQALELAAAINDPRPVPAATAGDKRGT